MAKAARKKRYRCRHPKCKESRKTWGSPQAVLAHRVEAHGGKWPTEGKRRKTKDSSTNGENGEKEIPVVRKSGRKVTRSSAYATILQAIPMQDLMGEISRRIAEAR